MDDKFKSKYRIPSTRLSDWDYSSYGLYYITICTKNRVHYFGDIVPEKNTDIKEPQNVASLRENMIGEETQNIAIGVETQNIASLRKSVIGEIAYNNWLEIPNHFPFIELDEFVIMPNHIHAILLINTPDKTNWEVNKFGSQSQNLASVIRGYKVSVKAYSTINNIEFAWQPRYYDRVIRDKKEYINMRDYIFNNPERWLLNGDKEGDLFLP